MVVGRRVPKTHAKFYIKKSGQGWEIIHPKGEAINPPIFPRLRRVVKGYEYSLLVEFHPWFPIARL
jgi:hypothetical protein